MSQRIALDAIIPFVSSTIHNWIVLDDYFEAVAEEHKRTGTEKEIEQGIKADILAADQEL